MDQKPKDRRIEYRLSIIGPVAGLLATIMVAYSNLPPTVQYIMIFLFIALTAVSAYVVFWHQIANLSKKVVSAIKHYLLVKKYLSQFGLFVDRLSDLSQDSRCDTLPYAFSHMKNLPQEFRYPRSLMYDLTDFLTLLTTCMKKFRKRDFELLIHWFESILRIYNNQLVLEPFRHMRNMDQDKLTKYEKEDYEKNREHYVRFLQDYESFARAMNRDAGKKIAREYFDKPGKLLHGNGRIVDGAASRNTSGTGKINDRIKPTRRKTKKRTKA